MNASALAVSLLLALAAAGADEPPQGEWRHTDLRNVEVLPGAACIRLWLEERTYGINPAGDARFTGTYFNVIRAAPVGVPSILADCTYPPPAENPLAAQFRSWSIVGNRTPDHAWRVRAEPGPPGGDLRIFQSEEFETRLSRRGEVLVDSTGDGEDPNKALLFRPSSPPPGAARAALEDTLGRLYGGACLEVTSKLAPSEDAAVEMCALRQRVVQLAGRWLTLTVQSATEFDRVPVGFPRLTSSGYRRQHGVFFSFLGRYERQELPGHALVFEEAGAWNVEMLWF